MATDILVNCNVEVRCGTCNAELDISHNETVRGGEIEISVEPCEKCGNDREMAGYDEGLEAGIEQAEKEGAPNE